MKYFHKTMIGKSILICSMSVGCSHALEIHDYPALVKLVDVMVRDDGYPKAQLEAVLGGLGILMSIRRHKTSAQ